ncbi:hypothetical protein Mgra_00004309 [Meloidogyne graminicola]|uniref:Uncharacterized protein n=1 Tax=Meloidogyne graminicola TaxID=189291 RepID=A0A8S9ZSA2_9BILA|nr:hypothetical protein Mgra_00004309 [Meloidogyne graminicola]
MEEDMVIKCLVMVVVNNMENNLMDYILLFLLMGWIFYLNRNPYGGFINQQMLPMRGLSDVNGLNGAFNNGLNGIYGFGNLGGFGTIPGINGVFDNNYLPLGNIFTNPNGLGNLNNLFGGVGTMGNGLGGIGSLGGFAGLSNGIGG